MQFINNTQSYLPQREISIHNLGHLNQSDKVLWLSVGYFLQVYVIKIISDSQKCVPLGSIVNFTDNYLYILGAQHL